MTKSFELKSHATVGPSSTKVSKYLTSIGFSVHDLLPSVLKTWKIENVRILRDAGVKEVADFYKLEMILMDANPSTLQANLDVLKEFGFSRVSDWHMLQFVIRRANPENLQDNLSLLKKLDTSSSKLSGTLIPEDTRKLGLCHIQVLEKMYDILLVDNTTLAKTLTILQESKALYPFSDDSLFHEYFTFFYKDFIGKVNPEYVEIALEYVDSPQELVDMMRYLQGFIKDKRNDNSATVRTEIISNQSKVGNSLT